jgi:hypothetical protein
MDSKEADLVRKIELLAEVIADLHTLSEDRTKKVRARIAARVARNAVHKHAQAYIRQLEKMKGYYR